MKQHAVVAYDYTNEDALERRLTNREPHLKGVRRLAADGHFISGGAILDEAGRMIGSNAHLAFTDRLALGAWLETEHDRAGLG
ncbi:YciI family protein [Modicisalibacter radicis]|uniref:YciI family protein n=1 Tax=Halomonas sp. EAR18 TaxID=2518972 RepID=UPI001FCEE7EE|nr:YciI family protein [Halomonas sp. EAR18]